MTLDTRLVKLEQRSEQRFEVKAMTTDELEAWVVASFGYLPSDDEMQRLLEVEHGDA